MVQLEFDHSILLQYIDKLAWPVLAYVVLRKFDREIKGFISRAKKFTGPGGWGVDAVQEQREEEKKDNKRLDRLASEIEASRNVRDKLLELLEETNKTRDQYSLLYFFERSYRLIFGSQLGLLSSMRDGNGKYSLTQAIIAHRASGWYEKGYDFNNWMQFLTNLKLVEYTSGAKPEDCFYKITDLGKLFLSYLEVNKVSLNKSY